MVIRYHLFSMQSHLACTFGRKLQHFALVRAVGIVREVSVKRGHWYRVGADRFYGCGNGCRKMFAGSEGFLECEGVTAVARKK
jgi:hypothetical protein